MKFIRIFLLVLIVIGLGLIATQKMWVPKLVTQILNRGDMVVNKEIIPDEASAFGDISGDNKIVVSGVYSYNQFIGTLPSLDFYVDEVTAHLIPRGFDDDRIPWFGILNQEKAMALLGISSKELGGNICEIKGNAEIEISKYLIYRGESEGKDGATLTKLLKVSPPTYINCTN